VDVCSTAHYKLLMIFFKLTFLANFVAFLSVLPLDKISYWVTAAFHRSFTQTFTR